MQTQVQSCSLAVQNAIVLRTLELGVRREDAVSEPAGRGEELQPEAKNPSI